MMHTLFVHAVIHMNIHPPTLECTYLRAYMVYTCAFMFFNTLMLAHSLSPSRSMALFADQAHSIQEGLSTCTLTQHYMKEEVSMNRHAHMHAHTLAHILHEF